MDAPAVSWFGDRAVLVTCQTPDQRVAVARHLASAVADATVRCGVVTLLVEVDVADLALVSIVEAALSSMPADASMVIGASVDDRPIDPVTIDVIYDGEDVADVAQALGMTPREVMRAHSSQAWLVDIIGFAPGFAYLRPDGRPLADWGTIKRRDSPRATVPAGSVAVAAGMSAVYPASMPGGWRLIGRTSAVLFDASRERRPALLSPGAGVRFRAVP
jgi:KipI family sensor histidine kinase inhibitor